MKDVLVATSYFYHIRFFKPYMIPISTAHFDPKWYHNFKGDNYTFLDKRGVINGLRNRDLRPIMHDDGDCKGPESCNLLHPGQSTPDSCMFLKHYEQQLRDLDLDKFTEFLYKVGEQCKAKMGFYKIPIFVFMVHEANTNPCSERVMLNKVLTERGLPCQELQYPIEMFYPSDRSPGTLR